MIIGHTSPYTFLEKAFANKQHQAFLLTGEVGIGKASAAKHLALSELTKASPFNANIVQQQCAAGSYPNYFYLTLIQDEDGKQKSEITIEQVRSLLSRLKQKAAIQGPRIVIIDSIDQMNRQGANALLKILEEPPQDTFFLLVCHSLGKVLPTIRSRCIRVDFKPLTNEEMEKFSTVQGEKVDKEVLLMAAGSPGAYQRIQQAGGVSVLESIRKLLQMSNMNDVKAALQDLLKQSDDNFLGYLLHQLLYNQALKNPATYAESAHAVEKFMFYTQGTHLDGAHRLQAALLLAKTPREAAIIYG
jgi:DNA polymerase-3 subunit delta'